jgi:hypothetical protein
MYKKLILLLPLFFGFGCCNDIKDYYNIVEFDASIVTTALEPLLVNVIEGDSIVLLAEYEPAFVNVSSFSFGLFMNSAYALSCEDPGQHGIKDKLVDMVVTSDHAFNGIPANESLNEFVAELETGIPIADFAAAFTTRPYSFLSVFHLVITQKPSQPEHQFTLTMTFESGRTIENQTGRVVWN